MVHWVPTLAIDPGSQNVRGNTGLQEYCMHRLIGVSDTMPLKETLRQLHLHNRDRYDPNDLAHGLA